jgi:hypothetical protein
MDFNDEEKEEDNESVDSMSDLFPEMFDLIEKEEENESESMEINDETNCNNKSIKRKLDSKVRNLSLK